MTKRLPPEPVGATRCLLTWTQILIQSNPGPSATTWGASEFTNPTNRCLLQSIFFDFTTEHQWWIDAPGATVSPSPIVRLISTQNATSIILHTVQYNQHSCDNNANGAIIGSANDTENTNRKENCISTFLNLTSFSFTTISSPHPSSYFSNSVPSIANFNLGGDDVSSPVEN